MSLENDAIELAKTLSKSGMTNEQIETLLTTKINDEDFTQNINAFIRKIQLDKNQVSLLSKNAMTFITTHDSNYGTFINDSNNTSRLKTVINQAAKPAVATPTPAPTILPKLDDNNALKIRYVNELLTALNTDNQWAVNQLSMNTDYKDIESWKNEKNTIVINEIATSQIDKKLQKSHKMNYWKGVLIDLGVQPPPENTDAINRQIASLTQQLAQSQNDAKTCQDALKKFNAEKLQELEQLRNELAASKGANDANSLKLQQQLDEAKKQLELETAKAKGLEEAQRKLQNEYNELKKQLANQERNEADLEQLREQLLLLQNKSTLSEEERRKLAELQALIKQNEEEKRQLEAEIDRQKAEIKRHTDALEEQKRAHEEALRKAQQDAEKAAAEAQRILDEAEVRLTAKLEQLRAANEQLTADLQNMTSERDQLKAANNLLNSEKATLETTILNLNDRIKQLEAAASNGKSQEEQDYLKQIAALSTENRELAGRNAGLVLQIETLTTDNTEFKDELAAATSKIRPLEDQVAELQRQLDEATAASGTATEKDTTIANLNQQLAEANLELNALKTTTIPGLEKQITDLTSRNAQLQTDLDNARKTPKPPPAVDTAQIDALKKERDEAKAELSKLKTQLSSASADKNTIADLQAKLTESEKKVLDLEQALSDCTNKPAPTTEIKSPSGSNIALAEGMVYIFQETRPLKIGGNSATRRIKLEKDELFVEDENNTFKKFDQQFYKDMYTGGEDDEEDALPPKINEKLIIEAVKNIIPKT